MNSDNYFVCKKCHTHKLKSPLDRNELCESCNRASYAEQFTNELSKLPFNIANKNFLHVMNVNIHDYEAPIIHNDYILIKVDESIKGTIHSILELTQLDIREEVIETAKYLLATNLSLDLERIECHLHNRFNKESCEFSRSVICGLNMMYADWSYRHKASKNVLNITTRGIDEISKLQFNSIKSNILDEVDAQYIISQLSELKDDLLFRGINKHYFKNDGIAASIYRNNPDLAEYNRLQEHESEIVNNLLSKDYYQAEVAKNSIYALTDLRHSGKDTCLLDFSRNLKVALFFSCHPLANNTATIGEILILSQAEYELKTDVLYPNETDFLITPPKTEVTGNRVIAQDSIFLYCHKGYIPRDKCGNKIKNLLIPSWLKPALYDQSGYSEEEIYPDFHGFIENPENFVTQAKLECLNKESDKKKYR